MKSSALLCCFFRGSPRLEKRMGRIIGWGWGWGWWLSSEERKRRREASQGAPKNKFRVLFLFRFCGSAFLLLRFASSQTRQVDFLSCLSVSRSVCAFRTESSKKMATLVMHRRQPRGNGNGIGIGIDIGIGIGAHLNCISTVSMHACTLVWRSLIRAGLRPSSVGQHETPRVSTLNRSRTKRTGIDCRLQYGL